jgi:drug/metabolite transporter (DMT)-like permease
MEMSVSIIAGLIPMFSWGIADFLQSISVRKLTTAQTMFISNIFWMILVIPFAFFIDLHITLNNIILVIIGALIQLVGLVMLYESMKIGDVSIVTPISASYPVVTVLLLMLLLGHKLSMMSFIAILVMTLGIIFTSTDLKKLKHIHSQRCQRSNNCVAFFRGLFFHP